MGLVHGGHIQSSGQTPGSLMLSLGFLQCWRSWWGFPGAWENTEDTLEAAGHFTADWMSFGVPRSWLT